MYKHLTRRRVPSKNITLLVDESDSSPTPDTLPPTRNHILNALCDHLRDNPSIQKGDDIIIHFSGHGSRYFASDLFTTFSGSKGSIEALCPADRGMQDGNGGIVLDISDREFNVRLSEIRDTTGANITVILDCCYSGGTTRTEDNSVDGAHAGESGAIRCAPALETSLESMLLAADRDPRRKAGTRPVCVENWEADMTSHVSIAACKDWEMANERWNPPHGIFTRKLISVLESGNWADSTYAELVNYGVGPLGTQQPHVVGERQNSKVGFLGYDTAGADNERKF